MDEVVQEEEIVLMVMPLCTWCGSCHLINMLSHCLLNYHSLQIVEKYAQMGDAEHYDEVAIADVTEEGVKDLSYG